jgi:hypothetical protein
VEGSHPMNAWDRRGLIEDALARALDDWLDVADFVTIAQRTNLTGHESLRALAMGLIADTLSQELLVAGDADELGFHDWETSPGDSIQRVSKSWPEDELSPTPGSVAWFRNTAKGAKVGEAVMTREGG